MSAKVRWRADRGAWFLYVYANRTKAAKRLGPTDEDKKHGDELAREVRREQVRGRVGIERRPTPVPFDKFADRWLKEKVQLPLERGLDGHLAQKTADIREQTLRIHLKPFLGKRDLRAISVQTVDELVAHWLEIRRPHSRRTMDIALGTLRRILADAVAKQIVPANVVDQWKANQPKGRGASGFKPVEEGRVLDSQDREKLLAKAAEHEPHYFPLVLFLAETGCRIGEALAVRWADVDLEAGEARVYRRKTGGQADDVELSSRLRAALAPLKPDIHPREALAFTTPAGERIDYANFRSREWKRIREAAFGKDRRVTPHSLRHTWATLHLSRGTPIAWVQRMGGWTSAKMLLDVYGHFLPRDMRGFSDAIGPLDGTRRNQVQGTV